MYDILQLNDMFVPELKELAKSLGLKGINRLTKQDLIYKILDEQALKGGGIKSESVKKEPAQNPRPKRQVRKPRVEKKEEVVKKDFYNFFAKISDLSIFKSP